MATSLPTKQILLYEAIERFLDFCRQHQNLYLTVTGFQETLLQLDQVWQTVQQTLEQAASATIIKQQLRQADSIRKAFGSLPIHNHQHLYWLESYAYTVHDFSRPQHTAVKGKVTNVQTLEPMAGVEIELREVGEKEARFWDFFTTDTDGLYHFKGIPHGKYQLSFSFQNQIERIEWWLSCGQVFNWDAEIG